MTTKPRILLILRHGETDGNVHRIMQTPETPLNQLGMQQATLAAARIVEEYGDKLVIRASDYTRARQTAEALSTLSQQPIASDTLLRERSLGDLRGRHYSDLGFDPFAPKYHPPNGESWQQFFERVELLFSAVPGHLDALPQGYVLVLVTHGLVCRALAENHLTKDLVHFPADIEPASSLTDHWPNTSLTALEIDRDKWTARVFNSGAHLNQLKKAEDSAAIA